MVEAPRQHRCRLATLALSLLFLIPTTLIVTPAAAQSTDDYIVDDPAFAPIDLGADATTVSMTDNEVTTAIPLGFTTTFFGRPVFDFWIGSNGFVTLHFLTPDGCCGGDPIPTPGGPDGMVAALWTDLDPTAGGTIRFERLDLGGAPALVVDYDQIPVKGSLSETVSFQVHIMENGTIETHYTRFHAPLGLDVTVGLENIDGSRGVEVLHETGNGTTQTEFALRYIPLDPPTSDTGSGYNVDEIAGGLIPFDDGLPTALIALGDDQVSGPIDLGFEVPFFGTPTSSLQVSSNGFVYLAPGSDDGCCSGDPIPSPGTPDGMIAGFWTDLHPGVGGSITTQLRSIDGTPARLVQFTDVPFCCSSGNTNVTFQVVVYGNGTLETRYGPNAASTGNTVTIGVENHEGTGGVQVFHGGASEDFGGRAFRFTPLTTRAYDVGEVPQAPIAHTAAATSLALGDDFVTSAFELGFQSSFFGTPTSEFWVGANGFVTLHFLTPDGCCQGRPMPAEGGPDGMVAPYWTDLDPSAGGTIRFERFDTGTQGLLAVTYDSIPIKGTNDTVSFQFALFQNGTFDIHYLDATIHEGIITSIGAENIDASDAIQLFHGDATTFTGDNVTTDNTTTDDNTTTEENATSDPAALIDGPSLTGRSFRFTPNFATPEPPAPAPAILDLTPDDGPSGIIVQVTGTDFDPNGALTFGGGPALFTIFNGTAAEFSVPNGLPNGVHTVRITNPDGQSASSSFLLTNPFGIQAISPAEARQGDNVTIFGGGFTASTEVLLDDRFVPATVAEDGAALHLALDVDLDPGIYDVRVRDPSFGDDTRVDGLTVLGRPDVAVTDLSVERDDVKTPVTPDGLHAPGPWTLTATLGNLGDLVGQSVEVHFLAGQNDSPGPLKDGAWEHVANFTLETLAVGDTATFTTEWGSDTSLGDHQFRVETTVTGPVADRFSANDAAETEDYSLLGGQGGFDPVDCFLVVVQTCPEQTIRWEDHETTEREQADQHTTTSVRLDATMESPDFSFNNFDLVFTNTETFPDGSFNECTTWRFDDRADGTFRVTMTATNGMDGTVSFTGGDASVLFGDRTVERKSQLVLDAGVRQVVLLETPPDRRSEGPAPTADTYTFVPNDPTTGDHFGWSATFQGLSGDFTHCALRLASGGGNDTFTFAALPDDLEAHTASFDGAGSATQAVVTIDERSRTVTERPVTDGV